MDLFNQIRKKLVIFIHFKIFPKSQSTQRPKKKKGGGGAGASA